MVTNQPITDSNHSSPLWQQLVTEAEALVNSEPQLKSLIDCFSAADLREGAIDYFASLVATDDVKFDALKNAFDSVVDESFLIELGADLRAYFERDPACTTLLVPWLYYKGFQSIQLYRIAHRFWRQRRKSLAIWLQHRVAVEFGVDIHPNAAIGYGIMLDHATGLVIGETARVGNNVSILHSVTLGGSGLGEVVRHPTVEDDVLISAGAKLLGDIHVGRGAKIAAGSVVLESVPYAATVAGVPARIVGGKREKCPAKSMDQTL